MKVTLKGNVLTIEIPADLNPAPSKTGKSLIVASTGGFQPTTIKVKGQVLRLNVTGIVAAS